MSKYIAHTKKKIIEKKLNKKNSCDKCTPIENNTYSLSEPIFKYLIKKPVTVYFVFNIYLLNDFFNKN